MCWSLLFDYVVAAVDSGIHSTVHIEKLDTVGRLKHCLCMVRVLISKSCETSSDIRNHIDSRKVTSTTVYWQGNQTKYCKQVIAKLLESRPCLFTTTGSIFSSLWIIRLSFRTEAKVKMPLYHRNPGIYRYIPHIQVIFHLMNDNKRLNRRFTERHIDTTYAGILVVTGPRPRQTLQSHKARQIISHL